MTDSTTDTGKKMHIAVLSGMQWAHGRNIVRGAMRYCQAADEAIQLDLLVGVSRPTMAQLKLYDGILTDQTEPFFDQLARTTPVITINTPSESSHLQHISAKERESGCLAARTLHNLRAASYGIYSDPNQLDSVSAAAEKDRTRGFHDTLLELGIAEGQLHILAGSDPAKLAQSLYNLPKPTAIFVLSDIAGLDVIQICHLLDLRIPQEVAVLGIGNDRLICSLCRPQLSSIDMRTQEIGYHALEALSAKIRNRNLDFNLSQDLAPFVTLRESTGHISSPNSIIQASLEAIRNAPDPSQLTAAQVASIAGTNLRTLEKLFKQELHTTLRQKMLEFRLEQVKRLLRTTDFPVDQICHQLGWEPSTLHHIFKRKQGQTASSYRKSLLAPPATHSLPEFRKKPDTLVIGFISPLADETGHDMLRGAQDFIRENPYIQLTLLFRASHGSHKTSAHLTGGESIANHDGFIATHQADIPPKIIGEKPVICFEHERDHPLNWSVHIDNRAVGETAANHFLNKGYIHFAYCDYSKHQTSTNDEIADYRFEDRFLGFRDRLLAADVIENKIFRGAWKDDQSLSKWLKTLPKPCGVFAFNDALGLHLLRCCELADLQVPQDIAILGTDNSEFYCNTATPTLSSIDISFRRAGYKILELMVKIIRARSEHPKAKFKIPVRHVVERESSRGAATADPALNAALDFIGIRHTGEITVAEIVEVSGISRRTLENRFKSILHRSILDEIQRTRIDTAANLLTSTSHSINEIAVLCGFKHTRHFCHLFKQQTGRSALRFRKLHLA